MLSTIILFLTIATSFYVLAWRGVKNTPIWMLYVSMAIMAVGGGVAINIILDLK